MSFAEELASDKNLSRTNRRAQRWKSAWLLCGNLLWSAWLGMTVTKTNPDFRDLFAELNAQQADFLVVGAHALAAHGHVRATKDLDVWVRANSENAKRVFQALASFGAPLSDLTVEDLATADVVFQIGVPPIRIDIVTSIDGVTFHEAWSERVESSYDDQNVHVLSRRHLIQNKKASGRLQDLADVEHLEGLKDS